MLIDGLNAHFNIFALQYLVLFILSLFTRAAVELEIRISSCFARDAMQHFTVTVCSLLTRLLLSLLLRFCIVLEECQLFIWFFSIQNASSGPYLCTKHTKCYSCGSSVPGNGLSVRYVNSRLEIYLCVFICDS